MTVPRTKAGSGEGVHRLVDMVVEEVSLVDRAANKHRFLIVKRDDAMPDPQPNAAPVATVSTTTPAATPASDSAAKASAGWPVADGSPLAAALGALESLTAIVELLGSLGTDSNDTRLAALAQQLRSAADEILERTGFAEPEEPSEPPVPASEVEARAKGTSPSQPPPNLATDVAAAKRSLARLTELVSKAFPGKTQKQQTAATPAPPAEPPSNVTDGLTKLAASFQELADAVKAQQQRLSTVEKQFGLPNSTRHAERAPTASHEHDSVGWPLDLNHPQDKASVDKSLSFHDL